LADLDLTNPVNQYKVQSFYANLASELAKAGGVAMISSSLEDPEGNQFTKLNNKNAFSFRLQKASDAVTTETVANIISILNNIKRDSMALDATNYFDYDVTLDQAETINESIGSVLNNLLMGALFAIIILFLFLRSWKMTLAVAISIPFSIVCTFIAMYFMGIGLNVISMSALALVIGMLVDNAIIILENIFRLRSKGLPIKEAAIKGASQILMAAFASTLTTICVFFPMFFVQGLIMEIFMDLVWVIILALGASLLVSIMFLPSIITTFRLGEKPQHKFKPLVATTNFIAKVDAKITKAFSKPKNWVTRAYDKTLKFCIKWKWATICVATLLFAASTLLVFFGNGFVLMPAMDSGEFSMTIGLNRAYKESGSTLNEHGISQKANGLSTEIYNELKTSLGSGNIKNIAVSYSTGSGMSALFSAGQTNLDVNIVLTNNRKLTTAEATEKAYTTVVGFLSSDAKHLFPKDDQDFDSEAHFVSSVSTSASMTMMAADNVVVTLAAPANPEPTVSDVGKTQSEIAQERLGDALELIYNELKAMNDAGILRITNSYSPYLIQKTNKRIMGSIDITIAQGHTVSKVQSRVDAKVNELFNTHKNTELKGITQVSDGFSSQFAETFTQMGAALIIGLILIYLIMVAMFASFKMPLIVLTTIPLAFTGGFALLAMAGMPMSIPAMVGLIMLMGVIVNNGIVLIDYINQARSDGLKISDAVIAGATVRARPIIMTALTTIIALIPLALGLGKGSSGAMMQPLAIVSIGGMTYAMLMSLLVVPAFYCIMHFKKMKKENQNEKINSSQLENEQNKGGDTQLLQGVRGKKSKV
jgi:HAE1 family hydrophobic/amphiphilic exporter-1